MLVSGKTPILVRYEQIEDRNLKNIACFWSIVELMKERIFNERGKKSESLIFSNKEESINRRQLFWRRFKKNGIFRKSETWNNN